MLNKNALQLFRRPESRIGDVFILRCLKHQEGIISKHYIHQPELEREVKKRLLADLWYELYGDVIKALPPLHHECLVRADKIAFMMGPENPIEKGFSDVMKLLRPPLEWMDDWNPSLLLEPKKP